ncbi:MULTISPECIES: TIM-barrel domain-containing protein [unclassified Actinomyces]|uniref:glycoside hydrolase family 31 protein n=1 Tax=unclassified Actinomyces TaxID=2609248 RepID=UPI000D5922F9|nr:MULTISPECIES: TIM-barrel domain-containing protein [unclassified Actinomyces]RAX20455.1 glycoside hydrolase family 31 protein [Actinomyces sp. Z3]
MPPIHAATTPVFEIGPASITWRGSGQTLRVESWGESAVRVRCVPAGDLIDTDWALLPVPDVPTTVTVDGPDARLVNGRLTVLVHADSAYDAQAGYQVFRARLEIRDSNGRTLLRELGDGGALKLVARNFTALPGGSHHLLAAFESPVDEHLYGMGQYQQEILDLKGSTFELAHRNSQASVPFVLSSAGYGFLWHNPAIGRATFALNRTEWVANATHQLDYWVTVGDSPAEISRAYADATGHAPMMPEFGLGYWQCKLRYWNQSQLLEVAREHTRRGLPIDVIVADFFHWPELGDYHFDEEMWPNPRAMVEELRELGIELMVSVWPQVSPLSENYPLLAKENLLVQADHGLQPQMAFGGPSLFLDPTNPRTRDTVWKICKRGYHDLGIRLFWLDEAEPEYGTYDFDAYRYHAGPVSEVGNIYPQAFSRLFYEGQVSAGQEDIVNLVRCAWAGSQRYGALVWSGDIPSNWTSLRRQLIAGLHMGVAGIPWFTTDIGGFHGGDARDPAFHELLVRWFQLSTFFPVMRMHGDRLPFEKVTAADGTPREHSGAANELWSFGEKVEEILTRFVWVREHLRPYTRSLMREAHIGGQPVMRGMFYEFPHDDACRDLADQYMFGPDVLVAPVLTPGATSREVYLPAGASWTHAHTGQIHDGGQWVNLDAPLGSIPVLLRDGALSHLIGTI